MSSHNDKSALLHQLTLDKNKPAPEGITLMQLIGAVSISLLVGAGVGYWIIGEGNTPASMQGGSIEETSANNAPGGAQSSINAVSVRAQSTRETDNAILNASGYITARRLATVSSEIMGRIIDVRVEEGMRVEKGQLLAQLDATSARVDFRLAAAQVDAQREYIQSYVTDLAEAERVLRRLTSLGKEHFASEAQRTRAEADVAKLRAALAKAKADLKVAEFNAERQQEHLQKHTIRAPFAGIITVKNAQPGEIVAPAAAGGGYTRTGICTLVDMESLEIEVDVNESYIGRVVEGQKVIANLDAYPDWNIPASVIAIIPTADRAKATVAVRIKIEVTDARILPNMGVKVAFYDDLGKSE